jgi:hypothetical protein
MVVTFLMPPSRSHQMCVKAISRLSSFCVLFCLQMSMSGSTSTQFPSKFAFVTNAVVAEREGKTPLWSWAIATLFSPLQAVSLRAIFLVFYRLFLLPRAHFPGRFPTKFLCIPPFSHPSYMPSPSQPLQFTALITLYDMLNDGVPRYATS